MSEFEQEISDEILIENIPIILGHIVNNVDEGFLVYLKHAVDLSVFLNIGEDVNEEGDIVEDGILDNWIDNLQELISQNKVEEIKEIVIQGLVEIDRFEVIIELKKQKVL